MQKSSSENETKQDGHIRPIKMRDRSRIEEMVVSSDRFNREEIRTALELVDEALKQGEKSGYLIVVLEIGKAHPAVKGYACYGPTPLTQGVYDLYWIVTDPVAQGKGFGRRLLQ